MKESVCLIQNNQKKNHLNTQEKIQASLVAYVYNQSYTGIIASLFCATIIVIGLFNKLSHTIIITWYIVCILITFLRFLLITFYLRDNAPEEKITLWRNLFFTGVLLSGISWGFIGLLLPYDNVIVSTMIIMILAGITAGAVPLFAAVLSACCAFIILVILPLTIRLLTIEHSAFFLLGITTLAYLIFLITLSVKSYKTIVYSIGLRFENDLLLQNLSDAKQALEETNQKLDYASKHDYLTDLANRSFLEAEFADLIRDAEIKQKLFAVFYLDVDKFKQVNDLYGHAAGDQLLKKVVERIKNKLDYASVAARIGGDELVIILYNIDDLDKITEIAQDYCVELAKPYEIMNYNILIGVSIGISIFPIDGRSMESLLKRADKAMYFAKVQGGNNYHFSTDKATIKAYKKEFFSNSK